MAGLFGLDSWSSAFTARYGAFIQPLPTSSIYVSAQTYADLAAELTDTDPVWGRFVPHDGNDFRGWEPGMPECSMDDLRTQYRFPIVKNHEHGHTHDVDSRAFTLSEPRIITDAEIEPGTMWFFTSNGMHKVTNVDSGWDRVLEAFDV